MPCAAPYISRGPRCGQAPDRSQDVANVLYALSQARNREIRRPSPFIFGRLPPSKGTAHPPTPRGRSKNSGFQRPAARRPAEETAAPSPQPRTTDARVTLGVMRVRSSIAPALDGMWGAQQGIGQGIIANLYPLHANISCFEDIPRTPGRGGAYGGHSPHRPGVRGAPPHWQGAAQGGGVYRPEDGDIHVCQWPNHHGFAPPVTSSDTAIRCLLVACNACAGRPVTAKATSSPAPTSIPCSKTTIGASSPRRLIPSPAWGSRAFSE